MAFSKKATVMRCWWPILRRQLKRRSNRMRSWQWPSLPISKPVIVCRNDFAIEGSFLVDHVQVETKGSHVGQRIRQGKRSDSMVESPKTYPPGTHPEQHLSCMWPTWPLEGRMPHETTTMVVGEQSTLDSLPLDFVNLPE